LPSPTNRLGRSAPAAFELETAPCYSLKLTVLSHGWAYLAPYCWDAAAGRLSRVESFPSTRRTVVLAVRQRSRRKLDVTASRKLSPAEQSLAAERLSRALQTGMKTSEAAAVARKRDPAVAALLRRGAGRLLRGATLFEDCVKTLCTTNASWAFTQQMVANLIRHYGTGGAFPSPEALGRATEGELRKRVRMGYRAAFLRKMVQLFLAAEREEDVLEGPIPGLGPYGFAHLRVLEGDYSVLPIDSEVRAYCREAFGCRTDREIHRRYEPWSRFAFGRFVRRVSGRTPALRRRP